MQIVFQSTRTHQRRLLPIKNIGTEINRIDDDRNFVVQLDATACPPPTTIDCRHCTATMTTVDLVKIATGFFRLRRSFARSFALSTPRRIVVTQRLPIAYNCYIYYYYHGDFSTEKRCNIHLFMVTYRYSDDRVVTRVILTYRLGGRVTHNNNTAAVLLLYIIIHTLVARRLSIIQYLPDARRDKSLPVRDRQIYNKSVIGRTPSSPPSVVWITI